jgi:transcriptional regulator with XRE-family HTH domain
MNIQELFIANLKDYRKLRRISQLQLAEKCDSSQTYIAEIEVGKKFPSVEMIERIAAALKIESYCLFQNTPINLSNSERILTMTKKKEMSEKIRLAIMKIIDQY